MHPIVEPDLQAKNINSISNLNENDEKHESDASSDENLYQKGKETSITKVSFTGLDNKGKKAMMMTLQDNKIRLLSEFIRHRIFKKILKYGQIRRK